MNEYCVYKHTKDNIVFYIGSGKTSYRRAYEKNSRSKEWWEYCNGEFDVIIDSYFENKEEALKKEKILISEHKETIVNLVSNGYSAMKGKKHTDTARKKMSEYWQNNLMTGQKNGMYGRKGELNPNFGNGHKIQGRKNINSIKIVEKTRGICYYCIADAKRELGISAPQIHSSLKTGKQVKNRKKDVFIFEYIGEK